MYPIPILSLTGGNFLPLPEGVVKSVVPVWYLTADHKQTVAVLLDNGDLYTQGDNAHGEIGDGTLTANNNTWFKTATGVKRVFGASFCFVIEREDGSWQYVGNTTGLVGSGSETPNWTDLPTTITSALDMSQVRDVHGGPGATMWLMNDGRMFGTGINANGCMGQGSLTASYSTPVLIQNTVKRVMVTEARTVYINSTTGLAYAAGLPGNILGNGNTSNSPSFQLISTPAGFFVEDMVSFGTVTLFFGYMTAEPTKKLLYSVGVSGGTAYVKESSTFGDGFSSFTIPPGYYSNLFCVDGKLYGLGTGPQGTPDGSVNSVPKEPTFPFRGEWDISKIDMFTLVPIGSGLNAPNGGHFMIYDGNLFFTGTSKLSQGDYNSAKFKNISQFNT